LGKLYKRFAQQAGTSLIDTLSFVLRLPIYTETAQNLPPISLNLPDILIKIISG
jgi:hypothetical protein